MADGDVVIRLRDVWDIATRTEGKVDLVVLATAEMRDKTLPDHEKRIRVVEQRLYALPSIATLIAAAALVVAILSLVHGSPPVPTRSTSAPQAAAQTPRVTVPAPTLVTAPPGAVQPRSVPTTGPRRGPDATTPVSVPTRPVVTLPPVTAPTPPTGLAEALQSLGVRVPLLDN